MQVIESIEKARQLIDGGKVIAYPTEAVYGFGCDPWNEAAVLDLLRLKERPVSKGLILLVANYEQLWPLIDDVPSARLELVKASWPGFVTWVFPKSKLVPDWVSGAHDGIAIRMTAHPIAHKLCEKGPIVSTSANVSGKSTIKCKDDLMRLFPYGVAAMVKGSLGGEVTVSRIYNVLDGIPLRGGS